jgi:hypothetical protein
MTRFGRTGGEIVRISESIRIAYQRRRTRYSHEVFANSVGSTDGLCILSAFRPCYFALTVQVLLTLRSWRCFHDTTSDEWHSRDTLKTNSSSSTSSCLASSNMRKVRYMSDCQSNDKSGRLWDWWRYSNTQLTPTTVVQSWKQVVRPEPKDFTLDAIVNSRVFPAKSDE